jgi:thiosulfate/3-mercaptopyruvate sulfurtransferase
MDLDAKHEIRFYGNDEVNPALRMLAVGFVGLGYCRTGIGQDTPTAYRYLDTAEVKARLGDPAWIIVDVRDSNAFNGWTLHGEKRGGRLPGAVNIALSWVAENMSGVRERLQSILGGKPLILYGTTSDEAKQMADLLVRRYAVDPSRVHILRADFATASTDDSLPLKQLPGYDRLVPPRWLFETMKKRPELRVYHVSWGKGEDYAQSHIPGAIHLNTDLLEAPPLWKVVPAAQLTKSLTSLGIARDTPVVLYAADNMAAARAAVVLRYAGVKDVRVLNGGLPAWTRARLPVESGRIKPVPVSEFGATIPLHPEVLVGIETARALLANPNKVLVDVRSWREHIGAVSGYPDIKARGRIPGTVWGHSGSDAHHMEDYRNPDNTLRDCRDIARFWAESGIAPRKQMIGFHCGTGWRACEAYLAAWVMGWENIAVYDSGWYEWSADPTNPIVIGDPSLPQAMPLPAASFNASANPWLAVLMLPLVLLIVFACWAMRRIRVGPGAGSHREPGC